MQLIVNYKGDSKQLRHIIMKLIKSGLCSEIKKMNYVSSFTLDEAKKVIKSQEKILILSYDEKNKEKLEKVVGESGMVVIKAF